MMSADNIRMILQTEGSTFHGEHCAMYCQTPPVIVTGVSLDVGSLQCQRKNFMARADCQAPGRQGSVLLRRRGPALRSVGAQLVHQVGVHRDQGLGEHRCIVCHHLQRAFQCFYLKPGAVQFVHLHPEAIDHIHQRDRHDHQINADDPARSRKWDDSGRKGPEAMFPYAGVGRLWQEDPIFVLLVEWCFPPSAVLPKLLNGWLQREVFWQLERQKHLIRVNRQILQAKRFEETLHRDDLFRSKSHSKVKLCWRERSPSESHRDDKCSPTGLKENQ